MIRSLWRNLKSQRKMWMGPVSLVFKFERSVSIKPGSRSHSVVSSHALPHAHHLHHRHGSPAEQPSPTAQTRARPTSGTAVIVGVGPGFGYALARRLAAERFNVVMVVRNADRLKGLEKELSTHGVHATSYGCDATDERSVNKLFASIIEAHGIPSLVVYSIQEFGPGKVLDIEVPAFESAWRHNCLGAFLVSRAAGRAMLPRGSGSIILVGSTSSIIGRAAHLNLAVGKFGQRALAQVLARELWPAGIHVAHVMVDADIAEASPPIEDFPQSDPEHIAGSILALHQQPRSAWSSEMDLRPWNEAFWEHC